jgi:DMSO reductase anchor subunit
MTKCTFCEHRLRDGLKPACAALCPTGALDCADLPESEMVNEVDGFPASELGPRIRIRPLATGRRLPVMTAPEPTVPFLAAPQASGSEITLRSEWSLAAFTTLAAALVAAFTGRLLGALSFEPVAFPLAAALAMGLAGLHLGKRTRAYRAVLNLRRSWLSREVVTLSAFFVAGTGALLVWPESAALGWAAAALGFVAMFCGNRVYGVLRGSPGVRGHSASLVGMAAYLAAVCVGEAAFAVAFGIGRAPFYLLRKLRFRSAGRPPRPLVSAVRLGLGFLVPLALWLVAFERLHLVLLACALAGELIDRCEFYAEIEKPSPRRQMAIDLERHLARGRAVGAPLAAAAAD